MPVRAKKKVSNRPDKRLNQATAEPMQHLEKRVLYSAFGPGNLAVLQADSYSANNTTATVVELTTTTANQTAVQSISIPGTGTNPIRISGSASSTGYLADTNDGKYLVFTGHNNTSTSANANTLNPRAVVTLDSTGTETLATTYTGSSGNQTRGADSLDDNSWYIGDQNGIYTNNGTSASPSGNFRAVKAFGGTLYVGQASSSAVEVSAISGNTVTALPGITAESTSFQDFYLVSSGGNSTYDELYALTASSATAGVIAKFSLVSGSWTANGTYTTTFGGFGLVAAKDATAGTDLYVTTGTGATSANKVLKLVDTAGLNSTINITTANNVTLYTAASTATLKGIAFTPQPIAPVITNLSPTSGPAAGGTTVTINGSNFNTSSIVSFDGSTIADNYVSPTQLTIVTPGHALGSVSVTVSAGSQTSNSVNYTYVNAQSTIGGLTVSPTTNGIGQQATFTATGVTAPTGDAVSYVNFYAENTAGTENPTADKFLGSATTGSSGTYALNYTPNNPPTGGTALSAGAYQVYAQANTTNGALSNPTAAQAFTITAPSISFNSTLSYVQAPSSGTTSLTIGITRSGDLIDAVSAPYTITPLSAQNGTNFTVGSLSGNLNFASGSTVPTQLLTITINSYASQIGNALFNVSLGSPTLGTVSTGTTTGVIQQAPRAFTAGDLAIEQVGDGLSTLVSTGNQVYLAEYSPGGTLVQDFPEPTYLSGTASSEGLISLSSDGHHLLVPGYQAVSASGALSSNTTVNREVVETGVSGALDGTAVFAAADFTNANGGGNVRGAASDNGQNIWVGSSNTGIRYATLGADGSMTSTAVVDVSNFNNSRGVEIFGGQLYVSGGTAPLPRVGTVGTGTPTTAGNTVTNLPNLPVNVSSNSSPYQFFLAHLNTSVPGEAPDTLYVADDDSIAKGGGIQKYCLEGSSWVLKGTMSQISSSNALVGLTAVQNGSTVTLYATSAGGLFTATDSSGFDQAPSQTTVSNVSSPALTASNVAFRGIAFAPIQVSPPTVGSLGTTTGPTTGGTTVTINGTNFTPYSNVSFGATAAASVTYVSPTVLLAVTPAGSGSVDVKVTTVDGTGSLSNGFTYGSTAPTWLTGNPSDYSYDGTTLTVTGPVTINANPGTNPIVVVTGSSAALIINPSGSTNVSIASINISAGANVIMTSNGTTPNVLVTQPGNAGLIIGSGGHFHLGVNFLDLQGASLSVIDGYITGGQLDIGTPNNIGSDSAIAAIVNHNTSGGTLYNTFDGSPTAGNSDVLVRATYYGDADLSGTVNSADYTLIDSSWLAEQSSSNLTGWYNGDFNYDNIVNGSDYTLIDNAFNTQGTALAGPTAQIAAPSATPAAIIATSTSNDAFFSDKKVKPSIIGDVEDLITSG